MAISNEDLNKYKSQWNNMSYDQQQETLKNNSKLQGALSSLGLSVKDKPTTTVNTTQTTPTTYNTNRDAKVGTGAVAGIQSQPTVDIPQHNSNQYRTDMSADQINSIKANQNAKQTSTTPISTPTSNQYSTSIVDTWNNMTYEQQQQNKDKWGQYISRYGLTFKQPEQNKVETPKTTTRTPSNTGTTQHTPQQQQWDYQDNSQARMDQIADNLNKYTQTNPDLFKDYDSFYNFFISGKGRSEDQIRFLDNWYANYKKNEKYNNMSAEELGAGIANGTVPIDYLDYIKNKDPQKYSEIMIAKSEREDTIRNGGGLQTIVETMGDINSNTDNISWQKKAEIRMDEDDNGIDDRREHYASEEEQGYQKQIADLNAANLEIDNIVKHAYDDLVKAYPGATKATLMAMAQDRNADLLREKENNLVELTRLQGYVNYMQAERQEMNEAGDNSIRQLQDNLKLYYTYSPTGIKELADAQYEASHPTLEAAENGTDTDKARAIESILQGYYDKYGDIIQRPMEQVIQDVIAEAKSTGKSLYNALKDNFITPLRDKPDFNRLSTLETEKSNWSLEPIKDSKGNIIGYVGYNQADGNMQTYDGVLGSLSGSGKYNSDRGVYNFSDAFSGNLEKNLGYKNNNPGNIKDGAFGNVVDKDSKNFAIFETPEDGFDALVEKIKYNQTNPNSRYYGTTIKDYVKMYAPKDDGNDPASYAQYLANKLGATIDTPISVLDPTQMAAAIARKESGYKYETYGMFRGNGNNGNQAQTQGDYYRWTPMDTKFEEAISNASTQGAKDALAYASTVYSNLYEIASDGSLDDFIESGDFQKIMSNINKTKALSGDTTRGQSFFDEYVRAVEKSKILNPNSLKVVNVLKNMIEQKLRDESGAAISSGEWLSNFEDYMPQAGEDKNTVLNKMQQWEKNVILKTLSSAGMSKKDYEWLFTPGSKYYKTSGGEQNLVEYTGSQSNPLGTWDFGGGSVAQMGNTGGEYGDLFSILNI